jgi:hypothetical protein
MKIGNTSQSNVPVPNFFLTKNLHQMEIFQISEGKKYFREKDLFRSAKDINFCNNQRNYNRKHDNFNRTKFIPDKTNINNFLKTTSSNKNTTLTSSMGSFLSNEKDKENPNMDTYANFRNFLEKTNVTKIVTPDLREEIKTNINVLIDKITNKYDIEKWTATDTRTNFINFNQGSNTFYPYSTRYDSNNINTNINITNNYSNNNINNQNMNSTYNQKDFAFADTIRTNFNFNTTNKSIGKFEDKNFNQTNASKFKTILRDKINGMTLDKKLKEKLVKNISIKDENSPSDKFYKTKSCSILNTLNKELNMLTYQDSIGNTLETKYEDTIDINTLQAYKTSYANKTKYSYNFNNEININDNFNVTKICLPQVMTKYSTVSDNIYTNQFEIDKLRMENKSIYDRFKGSNLFKDFPSPDRKEFVIKKGELLRANMRKDKVDKSLVDFSKYNASKHKGVFCENYSTNQGLMSNFKKSKETFV